MKHQILFVDDDPNVIKGLKKILMKERGRWQVSFANSGDEGLAMVEELNCAVVVSDMRMPRMDGIEFLGRVKVSSPHTVRLMLTGNTDQETATAAVNEGQVYRFATKPCEPAHLVRIVEAGVEYHQLLMAEKELLTKTLSGSVKLLNDILNLVDPWISSQSEWLRDIVRAVTQELKTPNSWEIVLGAMLAKIGHIALPQALVAKLSSGGIAALSKDEKEKFTQLPEVGFNLLRHIPRLEGVARIVRYQDKGFDGTGFPQDEVRGKAIPLGARIIKIVEDAAQAGAAGQSTVQIRQHLKKFPYRYDPDLLDLVLSFYHAPSDNQSGESLPIALNELALGNRLYSRVETADNKIIAGAGTYISPAIMARVNMAKELYSIKEPILIHPPTPRADTDGSTIKSESADKRYTYSIKVRRDS